MQNFKQKHYPEAFLERSLFLIKGIVALNCFPVKMSTMGGCSCEGTKHSLVILVVTSFTLVIFSKLFSNYDILYLHKVNHRKLLNFRL